MDVEWGALTRPEHKAVFNVLKDIHDDVIGRVKVKDGHDNSDLFAIATDLNRVMHAGNDDLARREHRFCGGCP